MFSPRARGGGKTSVPEQRFYGGPLTDRTGALKPGRDLRNFTVETEIRHSTGGSIGSMSAETWRARDALAGRDDSNRGARCPPDDAIVPTVRHVQIVRGVHVDAARKGELAQARTTAGAFCARGARTFTPALRPSVPLKISLQ